VEGLREIAEQNIKSSDLDKNTRLSDQNYELLLLLFAVFMLVPLNTFHCFDTIFQNLSSGRRKWKTWFWVVVKWFHPLL